MRRSVEGAPSGVAPCLGVVAHCVDNDLWRRSLFCGENKMKVTITCEGCGATLLAPAAMIGKRGKCPRCGYETTLNASMAVPCPSAEVDAPPPPPPPSAPSRADAPPTAGRPTARDTHPSQGPPAGDSSNRSFDQQGMEDPDGGAAVASGRSLDSTLGRFVAIAGASMVVVALVVALALVYGGGAEGKGAGGGASAPKAKAEDPNAAFYRALKNACDLRGQMSPLAFRSHLPRLQQISTRGVTDRYLLYAHELAIDLFKLGARMPTESEMAAAGAQAGASGDPGVVVGTVFLSAIAIKAMHNQMAEKAKRIQPVWDKMQSRYEGSR